MSEPSGPHLAFRIAAPPVMTAGRLRQLAPKLGWRFVAKTPPLFDGVRFVLSAADGPKSCWLVADMFDAVPETLGHLLSHELGCEVMAFASAPPVVAYERVVRGAVVEKLVTRDGDSIIEDQDSPLAERVRSGADLGDLLDTGWPDWSAGFDTRAEGRSVVIAFSPVARDTEGPELEIEPIVTCPECDAALARRQSSFGDFFGCIRFPECRGRRTVKAVEALRAEGIPT